MVGRGLCSTARERLGVPVLPQILLTLTRPALARPRRLLFLLPPAADAALLLL